MNNPVVKLKKKHEKRIKSGHLWIYSNEVERIDKTIPVGSLVDVVTSSGEYIGTGFFNPHKLITVRLLTRKEETINKEFFSKRIRKAKELRESYFIHRNSYRMVHSESDFLPGLIVDKYNDSYSIQLNSAGIENYQDVIVNILVNEYHAKNIILRNDTTARELEGLPRYKKQIYGEKHEEIISDGKLKFKVDLLEGQKTGIYLDQIENHHELIPLSKNSEVLDVFCNEGGFSIAALYGGASKVTSIDISDESLARFKENIELNGLDPSRVEIINDDAFDILKVMVKEGRKFDLINLDPPSFTKSKKNVPQAKKGYFVVNHHAFNLIKEGGYIATSSCSHHISDNEFLNLVTIAALKAKREFVIFKISGASPDHPVHPRMPETKYLKFMLIRVTN